MSEVLMKQNFNGINHVVGISLPILLTQFHYHCLNTTQTIINHVVKLNRDFSPNSLANLFLMVYLTSNPLSTSNLKRSAGHQCEENFKKFHSKRDIYSK